jgi:hypothetical protein
MQILGKEGLIVSLSLVIAPLVVLLGVTRLFPPWEHKVAQ